MPESRSVTFATTGIFVPDPSTNVAFAAGAVIATDGGTLSFTTLRTFDFVTLPYVAVIVTGMADTVVSAVVVMLNVADVALAGTVMVAGMLATASDFVRLTSAPCAPAGPRSVTVPTEVWPPMTSVGFNVSEASPMFAIVPIDFGEDVSGNV